MLEKRKVLLVSFVLFSLFFGAGNLIFPPFLGYLASKNIIFAMLGFLITSVLLPVLGVIVVVKFNGLNNLANKVGKYFSIIFIALIYLSIGPGLGIPRAASVPFEMAIAPYLPSDANKVLYMVLYSFVFFIIALWLSLSPKKLVKRIGTFLTPTLLVLMIVLFICFIIYGNKNFGDIASIYENTWGFMQGFVDGYQTMDTIAALNFGLVIAVTLNDLGINEHRGVMKYTIKTGCIAGFILMSIYIMLGLIGCMSSGIYSNVDNGATLLRLVSNQLFGNAGAIILALIFTLACLTTCVGLITSISTYFSSVQKRISYSYIAIGITLVSFLICNLGLNTILSISIPILNAIYPVSIVLIVLGLGYSLIKNNKYIFPLTIYTTVIISLLYVIDSFKVNLGFLTSFLRSIPFSQEGFGWVTFTLIAVILSIILNIVVNKCHIRKNV